MLRKLWFRWRQRLLLRQLTAGQRMAESWSVLSKQMTGQLRADTNQLHGLMTALNILAEDLAEKSRQIDQHLSEAEQLQKQQEVVVESLRGENTILTTEIAADAVRHERYIQKERAEASIQVMRQVAATNSREETR